MGVKVISFPRRLSRSVRNPNTGDVHLFAKNDGIAWMRNEWGIEYPVSFPALGRFQQIQPDTGATTRTSTGIVVPTADGTVASADDVEGPWQSFTTAAAINAAGGLYSTAFNTFRSGWYPRYRALIKTPVALANIRILAGVFSALPDTLPATLHGAWFRYDTTLDTTAFWRCSTAAGAAPTTVITSSPIAVSTSYILGIDFVPPDPFLRGQNPIQVVFSVATAADETVVATQTATLPLANQSLGYGTRVVALTAAAQVLSIGRLSFTTP